MKIAEPKSKAATIDAAKANNTEFVDPAVKNVDRIWDVSGDNMLFGRLSRGKAKKKTPSRPLSCLMEIDFLTIKSEEMSISPFR